MAPINTCDLARRSEDEEQSQSRLGYTPDSLTNRSAGRTRHFATGWNSWSTWLPDAFENRWSQGLPGLIAVSLILCHTLFLWNFRWTLLRWEGLYFTVSEGYLFEQDETSTPYTGTCGCKILQWLAHACCNAILHAPFHCVWFHGQSTFGRIY